MRSRTTCVLALAALLIAGANGWGVPPVEEEDVAEEHGRGLAGGWWCNSGNGGNSCDSECDQSCNSGCDSGLSTNGWSCDSSCDSSCNSGCDNGCDNAPAPPPPPPSKPPMPPPPELTQLIIPKLNHRKAEISALIREKLPAVYELEGGDAIVEKRNCNVVSALYGCYDFRVHSVKIKKLNEVFEVLSFADFEVTANNIDSTDGWVGVKMTIAAKVEDAVLTANLWGRAIHVSSAIPFLWGSGIPYASASGSMEAKIRASLVAHVTAMAYIDPVTHCLDVKLNDVSVDVLNPDLGHIDWDPDKELGMCQGDCDVDADCMDGYICHQREGASEDDPVPGCSGEERSGWGGAAASSRTRPTSTLSPPPLWACMTRRPVCGMMQCLSTSS